VKHLPSNKNTESSALKSVLVCSLCGNLKIKVLFQNKTKTGFVGSGITFSEILITETVGGVRIILFIVALGTGYL